MTSASITWPAIQTELVKHFTSPAKTATIQDMLRFSNFFEEWFTAECLSAIFRKYPALSIRTNENCFGFSKPDIALSDTSFEAVIEVKHLNPASRECRGRWNGAKGSTVVKDICALHMNTNTTATKRVLVFYGSAHAVNHIKGGTCATNRVRCLACSITDLQSTVFSDCGFTLPSPQYDGPVKLDTETGRLKVYNYGHAQTIFRSLQGSSRARTPQRGEDCQSARR